MLDVSQRECGWERMQESKKEKDRKKKKRGENKGLAEIHIQ